MTFEEFKDKHYILQEVKKVLPNNALIKELTIIEIPEEFKLEKYSSNIKNVYLKDEVHKLEIEYQTEYKILCEKYYSSEEVDEILNDRYSRKARSIGIPIPSRCKVGKFEHKHYFYPKEDILQLKSLQDSEGTLFIPITKEELDTGKYMYIDDVCEFLDITKSQWPYLRDEQKIQCFRYFRKAYVLKSVIEKIFEEFKEFCNKYCTFEETKELLLSPHFYKITPTPLLKKFKMGKFRDKKNAYSKEEINKKIEEGHGRIHINLDEYYHISDVIEMIDINSSTIKEVLSNEGVFSATYMAKTYYKKSDIDYIKQQQDEFYKNHITINEARDIAQVTGNLSGAKYMRIEVNNPIIKKGKFKYSKYVYPKNEFIEYINKTAAYLTFTENFHSTDITKEFRKKLELYPEFNYKEMSSKYPFATKLTLDFFDEKLLNSTRFIKTANRLVRNFVRLTGRIYEMLEISNTKDVHTLKTSNILEFLMSTTSEEKKYIIPFLEYVYTIIVYNISKEKTFNKKVFDIDKIIKKFKNSSSKKELLDADVYDLETFLEMIDYCKDVERHTKIILGNSKSDCNAVYVSQWLLVSINLNNGWRVGDLIRFPTIDIDDLLDKYEIYDLDWFRDNTLSLEQSRILLSRLYNHEYVVNKTQENNGFFISDDLCPSVATAYAILTFYREFQVGIDNKYIMQFGTDFNYPSEYMLPQFFKNFHIQDFKFGSNKTTSTLLTFMECIKGDEYDRDIVDAELILKVQQNIRAHKAALSTLNYLKLHPEKFDELTRNLFRRGEFGYIYASVANKLGLNIRNLKNTHEVDEVILLAQVSNSPWDIEIATGILNNADKERKEVLGRIDKMNFEQILNKFNDIVTKKNPSRKKGIQCFIGANNCDEINKDCVKCKNAIVTVYALNAIAKRLVSLLLEYQTTKFLGEKMKLSHSIFHYKKRIKEAMDMYGKDVVYSYIQLEKRDFLLIANSIKTTEQLLIERA